MIFNSNDVYKYCYCFSKDIEEYKQKRDKGENDSEISKALRNDDIDSFQSILSKDFQNLIKERISFNMFETFIDKKIRYLDYAAAYGSVKCFKYLLLNNEKVDEYTFNMAVFGGNNELIRIVDNSKNNEKDTKLQFNYSKSFRIQDKYTEMKSLIIAVQYHKNDLFDWIIEHKLVNIDKQEDLLKLTICSIQNCNAHALIQKNLQRNWKRKMKHSN